MVQWPKVLALRHPRQGLRCGTDAKGRLLAAPRVHLQVVVLTQIRTRDKGSAVLNRETFFRATIRPPPPARSDERRDGVFGRAASKGGLQVYAFFRIQAQIPDPIGRQATSITRTAEWGGRQENDPEPGGIR